MNSFVFSTKFSLHSNRKHLLYFVKRKFATKTKENLLGHSFILQLRVAFSVAAPEQVFPPYAGVGFEHDLVLYPDSTPTPHAAEQSLFHVNLENDVHPPSTKIYILFFSQRNCYRIWCFKKINGTIYSS